MSREGLEMVWEVARSSLGSYLFLPLFKALRFPFSNGLIPPPAPLQRMESSAVLFQHLSCQLQMLVHMVGLHHSLVCCAWSLQAELLRDTWGWRGACSYFCLSLSFSKLGFFSPITIGFEKVKFNFFSCPPPMFFLFYFVLLWFDCYRFKYQDTLGTSKQIRPKNLTVLRT